MFCTNCGSQIPDGSAFCPECGAKLTAPASYAAAPVAAVAKKGLNKKTIIIIAAAALALIVGLILILVLTSPKHKLVGTWVRKDEMYGQKVESRLTFKANGKGEMKTIVDGEELDSLDFKWKVGSKNKLTYKEDGDDKASLKYGKKAKKDYHYWYIDGKTLYFYGDKYTKK